MHRRIPCRPLGPNVLATFAGSMQLRDPRAGLWAPMCLQLATFAGSKMNLVQNLSPTCGQVPPHRLDGELDALIGPLAAALQAVQRLCGAAHVPAEYVGVSPGPSVQKIAVRGEVHLQQ